MSVVTAAAKAEALAAPERRSSNSSQLLAKPVGKPFAVGQKQLALARSATPTAGTVQHMLAANMTATGGGKGNSTDSGVASDDQDTSSQESTDGDQFTSPLGNLEPTGIMSVFFNTKVNIGSTAPPICGFSSATGRTRARCKHHSTAVMHARIKILMKAQCMSASKFSLQTCAWTCLAQSLYPYACTNKAPLLLSFSEDNCFHSALTCIVCMGICLPFLARGLRKRVLKKWMYPKGLNC